MTEPTELRQPLLCPECAAAFDHIPRKPGHYKCTNCGQKWSWGLGFEPVKKPDPPRDER